MIQLTNAEQAYIGQPIMLNALMIEAIYDAEGGDCRINMNSGHHYIVQETFEEISELLYPHSHVPTVPSRPDPSVPFGH